MLYLIYQSKTAYLFFLNVNLLHLQYNL